MQKIHLKNHFTLILFILFSASQVFAQDQNIKWAPLKLTPAPLPSALQFGYERVIGDQITVGGTVKLFLPRSLENADVLFTVDDVETANGIFESGNFSGYVITPELRYYTSARNGAPDGFYLVPFLRYFNYGTDGDFVYSPIDGRESSDIDAKINFSGIGAGFGIGFQKVWDSGFLLDWNAGLGLAITGGRLKGTIDGPLEEDIPQFVDDLSEVVSTLPLVNARFEQDGEGLNIRAAGLPWPILKTQIAIGYAF
ncbi:MAG: hypothetical protein AAF696_00190 [Bacteroidota bacterium]